MRDVVAGFFAFTEVPPHAQGAYDEWHRLDHLPEQYAIDGVALGQRWVANPSCLAARVGGPGDPLLRAQHLTLYLMTEPLEATLVEFRQLAVDLRAAGRFFADREAHLAGPWPVAGRAAAPRVLVRPEVVPWRPATGVYAAVGVAGDDPTALEELVGVAGVAGAWSFDDGALRIDVLWLDGDPLAVAADLAPLVVGARLAGPYVPAGPGAADGFCSPVR